jgi:hypothetical protein
MQVNGAPPLNVTLAEVGLRDPGTRTSLSEGGLVPSPHALPLTASSSSLRERDQTLDYSHDYSRNHSRPPFRSPLRLARLHQDRRATAPGTRARVVEPALRGTLSGVAVARSVTPSDDDGLEQIAESVACQTLARLPSSSTRSVAGAGRRSPADRGSVGSGHTVPRPPIGRASPRSANVSHIRQTADLQCRDSRHRPGVDVDRRRGRYNIQLLGPWPHLSR